MSRRTCKRVSFSPDSEPNDEIFSSSQQGRRRVVVGIFSPATRRLLRRFGARVSKTLRFISFGKKSTNNTKTTPSSSSSLSCSSTSSMYLMKSKSLNESESHRAEAIEDCIEFLNSSSSMSRTNSVSAWSC